MNQAEQQGKNPVRKLGRGLSALLGAPVHINIPTPQASEKPAVSAPLPPVTGRIQTMQETVSGNQERAQAVQASAIPDASQPNERVVHELPVERIVPNRRQPRTDFDEKSLRSLADSIASAGLMQPILVRPTATGFEIIAGERRWRAAKLLGLPAIPAIIRALSDQNAAELALIENIQREDLNPMERAIALRRLALDFAMTHQQIADKVGLDRVTVSNLLRLSDLDAPTAELVRAGKLSQGHAKALLSLLDIGARAEFAARSIAMEWSVRELERQVQQALRVVEVKVGTAAARNEALTARDANVADLERQLAEHLGTKVTLNLGRKKGSGRLVVNFYNLDQFDGIMQKLGFGGKA